MLCRRAGRLRDPQQVTEQLVAFLERHVELRHLRVEAGDRVTDVEPERGYTFDMGTQTGTVQLVSIRPNRTRLDFVERFHLTKAPRKWFEGPIYRFINLKNEAAMRGFSRWLVDHPDYRPDLVEPEADAS